MHPGLGAVVGTAGAGYFKMQVVGEDLLLNAPGQLRRIIVGEGADIIADAGADISGSGGGISGARLRLVDLQQFDNGLQLPVDLFHILQADALDLKSLAGSQMDDAVAVGLGNLLNHAQDLRFQIPSRHPDSGSPHSSFFGNPEGVFL